MLDNMPEQPTQKPEPGGFTKSDQFTSTYANNVQFDVTIWDLNVQFGELKKNKGEDFVYIEQHTAVTMSWLQAKLMVIYLLLNIAAHETNNGSITIPKVVLPPNVSEDDRALSTVDLIAIALQRNKNRNNPDATASPSNT